MIDFKSDGGRAYRYDPNRPLGGPGSYGMAFEALAADGSPVAVKVVALSGSAADAKLAEREVTIGRSLPAAAEGHLLPLLDVAHLRDQLILVMPRACRSLADLIAAEAPLDPEGTSEILLQVATALQSLAAASVLHRDIKPANILELDGRWHLADFGISRLMTAAASTLTFRGGGTSEYRAPELWRGGDEKVGSDLYALGCIGYELLTGVKAFPGPHFRDQHLGVVPELPAGTPAQLRGAIMDLLAKEPASRPPDARAVIDILRPRPWLGRGQRGLQAMRAHSARARLAREAAAIRVDEYAEQQRQAGLRWDHLWKTVVRHAFAAVPDAEAGEAANGEPFLIVGDARLLVRLQAPQVPLSPLLMVGQLVATMRDYPGDAVPANLACLWIDEQPEWLILRAATTPGPNKMAGIGVGCHQVEWAEDTLLLKGRNPTMREAATADLILELFDEAIAVSD
ncbi:Serine/threonine-protein kinase PrkC [Micromonospora sp. MH33]|uniref:serine/threonine-protein kinase n=1 Tax=Micromonospora sp. MH33 TaxID=1945509 RepID=UPI000D2C3986|nr:serine/threonine-protein kinase [Micromonospora sp. MH33]PSK62725.1 Serine/threonine-protein kinase PrkC [Micromonospora sp. MH33]